MEKNKVKVTIAGVDYALTTEETPEYTTMLAAEIDEKMKELRAVNPFIMPTVLKRQSRAPIISVPR